MTWRPINEPPPIPEQKPGGDIIESVAVHVLYNDGTHGNAAYFFADDTPYWCYEAMREGKDVAQALDDGRLKAIAWRYII